MKWYVSVFSAKDNRLVWASPVDTLTEAMRLAKEAARHGCKAFVRSPTGVVTQL